MIKIVRIGEFMFIGEMDADLSNGMLGTRGRMSNPRVVQMNQQGQLMMVNMIGDPAEMDLALDKMLFGYTLTDEGMINSYRQAVTGLVIARPGNVVDMGRVKQ